VNRAALAHQAQDPFHARVPLDTVIVESPAPAIQPFFEFFLNMPPLLQQVGALVAVIAVIAVAVYAWRKRAAIRGWFAMRSRAAKLVLAGAVVAIALTVATAGALTYDYVQHENAFCNSCHIMNDAYMRFAGSEHAQLGCHDCHRQPLTTSLRQLVLWVAERPEEIPPHSPVPTDICAECHLQWRPDTLWMTEEAWRNVGLTAGHMIHLESADPDLADIQCADCHGVNVHRFIPVESTCLSSGCHDGLEIQLGRMATAPQAFHCAGCHEFTARADSLPSLSTETAARRVISPAMDQCYSCHEMERVLPREEVAAEPHEAACGLCHNPHTQLQVAEAAASCASAGCHDRAEELTPFHRGLHVDVQADCTGCHTAHAFRVDGSDCLSCHTDIFSDGRGAAASNATGAPHAAVMPTRGRQVPPAAGPAPVTRPGSLRHGAVNR
jgi:hypothetical protein